MKWRGESRVLTCPIVALREEVVGGSVGKSDSLIYIVRETCYTLVFYYWSV